MIRALLEASTLAGGRAQKKTTVCCVDAEGVAAEGEVHVGVERAEAVALCFRWRSVFSAGRRKGHAGRVRSRGQVLLGAVEVGFLVLQEPGAWGEAVKPMRGVRRRFHGRHRFDASSG